MTPPDAQRDKIGLRAKLVRVYALQVLLISLAALLTSCSVAGAQTALIAGEAGPNRGARASALQSCAVVVAERLGIESARRGCLRQNVQEFWRHQGQPVKI